MRRASVQARQTQSLWMILLTDDNRSHYDHRAVTVFHTSMILALTLTIVLHLFFHQSVIGDRNHFGRQINTCSTTARDDLLLTTVRFRFIFLDYDKILHVTSYQERQPCAADCCPNDDRCCRWRQSFSEELSFRSKSSPYSETF